MSNKFTQRSVYNVIASFVFNRLLLMLTAVEECIAQSTSRLLLQTASTTSSRDLFIDAPDWPWMVSLHGGPHRIFFCGASVLNAHWLLTAAH